MTTPRPPKRERVCEYDGTPLRLDADGYTEACPVCAADIERHGARCVDCRVLIEEMRKRP